MTTYDATPGARAFSENIRWGAELRRYQASRPADVIPAAADANRVIRGGEPDRRQTRRPRANPRVRGRR